MTTRPLLLVLLLGLACMAPRMGAQGLSLADMRSADRSRRLGFGIEKPGLPDGAKILLETDKAEYFLGENVLIQFGVLNTSATPFKVETGGDYRGASRAQRFEVTVRDADGNEIPDPDPSGSSMGGLSAPSEVKPGETFWEGIALMRYGSFDKPGEYTIRVQHDLGWAVPAEQMPAGEIRIRLVMPTPQQAEKVVGEMAALKGEGYSRTGMKRPPFADYSTMRYPVYLPILAARARTGDTNVLPGIGAVETPEATAVLIGLMEGENEALASEAARHLSSRLPDPDFAGDGPRRGAPFIDPRMEQRRTLAAAAWRSQFATPVRDKARAYLTMDAAHIVLGAFMLECVGTGDDLPAVIAALEKQILLSKARIWKDDEFPSSPGNADGLERAARQLVKRGGTVPARPGTPGELALLAIAVQRDETFRPAGWDDAFAAMLGDDIPYLRHLALVRMPRPAPERFRDTIGKLAEDADLGVQNAALNLIADEKLAHFLPVTEQTLKTSRRWWVLNAADNAAWALDSKNRYLIWADRLNESGLSWEAMQRMQSLIENAGGGGWNTNVAIDWAPIQKLWQQFLRANAAEIRAGRKFPAGREGGITEAMIPPGMTVTINGKPWPDRR